MHTFLIDVQPTFLHSDCSLSNGWAQIKRITALLQMRRLTETSFITVFYAYHSLKSL